MTTNQATADSQTVRNARPDMVFVIGVQDAVTMLAEQLCKEFGLRVHLAMKRDNPSLRIETIEDDAVIVPDLGCIDQVFVSGLKVSEKLTGYATGGPVECNWTDGADAFAFPLSCVLSVAAEGGVPLPTGWTLRDIPNRPPMGDRVERDERWMQQWHEAETSGRRVGFCGPSGTVVADFGNGKQLLQLPDAYSVLFPMLENRDLV